MGETAKREPKIVGVIKNPGDNDNWDYIPLKRTGGCWTANKGWENTFVEIPQGFVTKWRAQMAMSISIGELRKMFPPGSKVRKIYDIQVKVFADLVKENRHLGAQITALKEKNKELEALFDLQHTRVLTATKLWQKAHKQPRVHPDLGKLVEWLLSQMQSTVRSATILPQQTPPKQAKMKSR